MKSLNLKLITLLLVFIVSIALTVSGTGLFQSTAWADEGNSIGVGALVVLGVWGSYKLFTDYQQNKYDTHLEHGQQYLDAGNYELAIKNLQVARKIENSVQVNQFLTTAKSNYQQQHYKKGMKYFNNDNWELAYQEFDNVQQYGEYLDSNLKQEQAYKQLRKQNLKRVAVIEFEDNSFRYDLGTRTTGFLISELLNQEPDFLEIVERNKLSTILDEQKLQASGLIKADDAREIGNLVGANYLLVGKVISGEVNSDKTENILTKDDGTEVTEIRVEKETYVEVLFKLIDVSNASVVVSKSFDRVDSYRESYREDEPQIITSDDQLLNTALKNVTARFASILVRKYSL